MDVRQKEAQAKKVKRDSELVQEREDRSKTARCSVEKKVDTIIVNMFLPLMFIQEVYLSRRGCQTEPMAARKDSKEVATNETMLLE